MVAATVVSKMKSAMKIQNAAQNTASLGGKALVATTEAMQLAASFIPLVKLNARAISAVMRTIATISAVLNHYAPDLARNGLGHVGSILKCLGDILFLDKFYRIFFELEEVGHVGLIDVINGMLDFLNVVA